MKPALRNDAGFSLVEVMVAILILGIALAGLTQGVSTALNSSKDSELQTTAALFAAGQIEQLRAEGGLSTKETEGDCGAGLELYRWKQIVTPTQIEGLHEVTVIIESTRDYKPIYELRTLLFEPAAQSDKKPSSTKKGGQT
jgi:prepilin-type N-terminal cleavage/methylation domain-containing protein